MSAKPHKTNPRRTKWVSHHAPMYSPPGSISVDPSSPKPVLRVIAYGPDTFVDQSVTTPRQIADFLHKHPVIWVNVDGLGDAATIKEIGEMFGVHRLALEDVVHVRQRAKVDEFPGPNEHLFIVARMLDRTDHNVRTEQLSIFLGKNFVLTFQERPGDCLDAIRLRAKEGRGHLREAGSDYLAYSILDAVIDEYFPLLEALGDRLEELEQCVLLNPAPSAASQIHQLKRELLVFRRGVWPLREALSALQRGTSTLITHDTRLYLRDCSDHTFQVLDLIEVYRELAAGLVDLYMTSVSYRMNQIMKVLTIIATIFIPLTFVVGIYGMNFDNMPELHWRYGYFAAMGLMAAIALVMLGFFWHKGWLNREGGGGTRDEDPAT